MTRSIKLGLIIPDINDPTSYYRGMGPMTMLQKQIAEIDLLFPQPPPDPSNWGPLKACDIIFMQRPALPVHVTTLLCAKEEGLPVWVDFDDDNLSVPKDNAMYPTYAQPQIKDSIVKLARYADVITVSTEKLRKKYSIYNKNCFVVPNALDDFLLRVRAIPSTPREKLMLWRGTSTHLKNLRIIEKQIIEAANKHSDWKFGFLGYDPIDITDNLKNHEFWHALPIKEFFKLLCQVHASAVYYSLADNDHAQSRSHVSWLEATFGSALFIGPDHEEFKRPGTLNYKTPEEFLSIMEAVMNGEVDINKHVEESWAHIQENYMLSKVNNLRAQILKQLAERIYGPSGS